MKKVTAKLIASALIISFLVLPADPSAKQKRGANLIVTRLDESQVAGKPETVVNEYWNKLRAHAREPPAGAFLFLTVKGAGRSSACGWE